MHYYRTRTVDFSLISCSVVEWQRADFFHDQFGKEGQLQRPVSVTAEPSRAKPSRAEPNWAALSQAGPSQAKLNWAEPSWAELSCTGCVQLFARVMRSVIARLPLPWQRCSCRCRGVLRQRRICGEGRVTRACILTQTHTHTQIFFRVTHLPSLFLSLSLSCSTHRYFLFLFSSFFHVRTLNLSISRVI